tara:strand:- start:3051 stop:3218 length:168 start_codon:yes stop_codon:yes gene_type:complete
MTETESRSLAHCAVLNGVEQRTVKGIEAAATWNTFAVGEQICVKGEVSTDFIFLV